MPSVGVCHDGPCGPWLVQLGGAARISAFGLRETSTVS